MVSHASRGRSRINVSAGVTCGAESGQPVVRPELSCARAEPASTSVTTTAFSPALRFWPVALSRPARERRSVRRMMRAAFLDLRRAMSRLVRGCSGESRISCWEGCLACLRRFSVLPSALSGRGGLRGPFCSPWALSAGGSGRRCFPPAIPWRAIVGDVCRAGQCRLPVRLKDASIRSCRAGGIAARPVIRRSA